MRTLGIVLLVLVGGAAGICSLAFAPGMFDAQFGGAIAIFVIPGLLLAGLCGYFIYRLSRRQP